MIPRIYKLSKSQSFFLFGPRGSGKSTWLKEQFDTNDSSILWINLLDKSLELKLLQDPDYLLYLIQRTKHKWVIIDEVQKVPQILDVVHRAIEEYKIKFALTGSSARKLKRNSANLLGGRAIERQLLPFSVLELGDLFNQERAVQVGLLPKIWDENLNFADAADFLFSYINIYLKEEVAAEQLVRNLDPFRRFLVSAAQSNGKIINHSAIERDCGVDRKQSERHFEILQDTLIGSFLNSFDVSIRKRQAKKAKFYFFDHGVVRALQDLAHLTVEKSTFEYGDLFETMVINEFFKLNAAMVKRWRFSYFQTKSDHEIDLIIEKPRGKIILIEIKATHKVTTSIVAPLLNLKSNISHEQAYLLSNDKTELDIKGVRCLHWIAGLKEIFEI